jgi:hypothetical protein
VIRGEPAQSEADGGGKGEGHCLHGANRLPSRPFGFIVSATSCVASIGGSALTITAR